MSASPPVEDVPFVSIPLENSPPSVGESPTPGLSEEVSHFYGLPRTDLDRLDRLLADDPTIADGWEGFFCQLDRLLHAIARHRRGAVVEAEDAVQEAWLILIDRVASYRPTVDGGGFLAWLAVVVRNRLANLERHASLGREVRLIAEDASNLIGREPDPADAFERSWVRASVRAALDALRGRISEESYRVVVLRWLEGRTVPEIATALGMSAAQVRDRHRRAFPVLRMLLEKQIPTDVAGDRAGRAVANSQDHPLGEVTL